ncbi:MAG TPA: hypothetical protein VMX57_09090, partial [Planctomycetota bacterium]|nr:hypothetical protein [Planctomycetota bacterium]
MVSGREVECPNADVPRGAARDDVAPAALPVLLAKDAVRHAEHHVGIVPEEDLRIAEETLGVERDVGGPDSVEDRPGLRGRDSAHADGGRRTRVEAHNVLRIQPVKDRVDPLASLLPPRGPVEVDGVHAGGGVDDEGDVTLGTRVQDDGSGARKHEERDDENLEEEQPVEAACAPGGLGMHAREHLTPEREPGDLVSSSGHAVDVQEHRRGDEDESEEHPRVDEKHVGPRLFLLDRGPVEQEVVDAAEQRDGAAHAHRTLPMRGFGKRLLQ